MLYDIQLRIQIHAYAIVIVNMISRMYIETRLSDSTFSIACRKDYYENRTPEDDNAHRSGQRGVY